METIRDMAAPIKTIIVPLDGSELAEQALPVAIDLAKASGAELHLLHVFVPYAARADMPGSAPGNADLERRLEAQSTEYLRAVTDRVAAELPARIVADPVRTRPIRSAHSESVAVVDRLRRAAVQLRPDLMVLATHARGGLGRAWLGSVADAVVRRVNVPTLLVHPHADAPVPSGNFSRILVPLDGSALAEEALPIAARIAAITGARVTLLRVIVPRLVVGRPSFVVEFDAQLLADHQRDAERYMERMAERIRGSVRDVDVSVLLADGPAHAIIDWVEQHEADLVVMSTHGRSGFRRFMLGSVADKVLRGTDVPVLLTRPGDSRKDA
jgi:nucleotide-binding universal stress UspA family protein